MKLVLIRFPDITSYINSELAGSVISTLSQVEFLSQDIYLNGKKLILNINYTQTNNQTQILNANALPTGVIFSMPSGENSLIRYTGQASQSVACPSGIIDGERVWLDGLRQVEGVDYIKICSINLQNSNNFIPSFSDVVYNNNKQFFNI